MILPKLGLCIGIPCSRPVTPEWAISLAIQNWPSNLNVMYIPMRGLPVDQARECIVESALKLECPLIWFVDDDVEVPIGAARQLVQTIKQADDDVMVVGGIYPSRTSPVEPIVYQGNGQGSFWKWKKDTIFPVTGIGTGCMVIKTEVFKHLKKPWFKTIDEGKVKITDDLYFCDKVLDAGFKILADAHVLCSHWDNANQRRYDFDPDSKPLQSGLRIDKALEIPGWMTRDELQWLAEQAKFHKRIVEVGSFVGRSTRALADNCGGVVWAFDNWQGPRDVEMTEVDRQSVLGRFKASLMDMLDSGTVKMIEGDHGDTTVIPTEFLRGSDEDKPDMVFIDGSHEYEDVRRDIQIWGSRLAKGGILCGHDANWDTVKKALDELLPDYQTVPGTSIWFFNGEPAIVNGAILEASNASSA